MSFDINDIASIGMITDQPPYQLPPEAWSLALNMRPRAGGMELGGSWAPVFGTPSVAPHFIFPVSTPAQSLWIYTSLTKAYAYDGTTHADITRDSADYAASATQNWNKTIFGGIPILNNGTDVPQMWTPQTIATKLADLSNWPTSTRARIVRSFGPYLIAFNITESGSAFPHRVQWSHPADPGSVPSSWDYTDPTLDAGIKDLEDVQSGVIVDALPLQSTMFIYKQGSIWKMRTIGGRFIFSFETFVGTVGALAPRCVCVTGDGLKHVVVTQDNIVWHDGSTVQSILDDRMRNEVFSELDSSNFETSFLFCNPAYNEVWFCYPNQGATQPNVAIVWNYKTGAITKHDGIAFRNAEVGDIENALDEDWDSDEEEWDDDDTLWSEISRHKVILAGTDATKIFVLDQGNLRDGVPFTGTLQREGLAVLGRKRNGEWIVDFEAVKMFRRLWPKIQGGEITVRVGSQMTVGGAISWSAPIIFRPDTQVTCDFNPISGRALAIEFASESQWRMDGYKADIVKTGGF